MIHNNNKRELFAVSITSVNSNSDLKEDLIFSSFKMNRMSPSLAISANATPVLLQIPFFSFDRNH